VGGATRTQISRQIEPPFQAGAAGLLQHQIPIQNPQAVDIAFLLGAEKGANAGVSDCRRIGHY
jgi:hypothetical protein